MRNLLSAYGVSLVSAPKPNITIHSQLKQSTVYSSERCGPSILSSLLVCKIGLSKVYVSITVGSTGAEGAAAFQVLHHVS